MELDNYQKRQFMEVDNGDKREFLELENGDKRKSINSEWWKYGLWHQLLGAKW